MRHWMIWAMLLLTGMAFSGNVLAASLAQQRAAFKAISGEIESGHLKEAAGKMPSLKGYVLYPYLKYDYLKARLQAEDTVDGAVRTFLREYPALPVTEDLRTRWLHQLSKRGDWQLFLKHYRASRDPGLRCNAALAWLERARSRGKNPASDQTLVSSALDLWNSGWSRPKTCNPVFEWLSASGRLTPARYQQRVDLALRSGHAHLAEYLADSQKGKARQRTLARVALRVHPADWLEKVLAEKPEVVDAEMVTKGLQNLARNQPAEAGELQGSLAAAYDLTPKQTAAVQRMIALGYAWDRQPEALDKLAALSAGQVDGTVRIWRVRAALYQQDWDAALAWLQQLKPATAKKAAWRYWKARILAARGYGKKARKLFRQVANGNGYYGWLAAGRLGQDYHPSNASVPLKQSLMEKIESKPGIVRARELYRVGWFRQARVEWRLALPDKPDRVWRQAGLLAQKWGWHAEAIISLANAGVYDDLTVTYPLVYKKAILKQARKSTIQPAWLYAVIRAESLFMSDAHSYAGARGLMQLMPATAREIARRNGVELADGDALYKPSVSIRLGSRYLQRLAGQFNGNLALATAAYNAGPSRVEYWLPEKSLPLDIWVANIPYNQTRHYVKRVLGFMALYEWRLHQRVVSADRRMQPVSAAINLAGLEP